MRDFPVVPEKGGNLPYKGNVQHTTVGKGMFPEEINHRRVRVVSETTLFDTSFYLPLNFSVPVAIIGVRVSFDTEEIERIGWRLT
jgi:hypothetical protein